MTTPAPGSTRRAPSTPSQVVTPEPFPAIPPGENNNNMKIEMREISNSELEKIEGGELLLFTLGVVVAAGAFLAKGIIDNWADVKKGFVQGYNTFI